MFRRPSRHTGQLRSLRHTSARRDRSQVTRRLGIESLESRVMLDAGGLAWTGAPQLTLSFAPDGTDVAGQPSALYGEFQTQQMAGWQETIVRAFQTWAQYTSTRIQVVADSGDPFGTPGATQSDPRFGDVRVAAVPLSSDVIAMSVPHDEFISGTWAGDILINSNASLTDLQELYSVALHEAGHVFGLGHSDNPRSPMFIHGISQAVTPTAQDIAQLRKLYQVTAKEERREKGSDDYEREEHERDALEETGSSYRSEQSLNTGVQLVRPNSNQMFRYESSGVITSASDVDYFRLVPRDADAEDLQVLSVTVRATERGRLMPQVDVFSRDGRRIPSEVLANTNGTLVLQVKDVKPEESYVVRVKAADAAGPYQSGRYQLEAQFVGRQAKLDQFFAETAAGWRWDAGANAARE